MGRRLENLLADLPLIGRDVLYAISPAIFPASMVLVWLALMRL